MTVGVGKVNIAPPLALTTKRLLLVEIEMLSTKLVLQEAAQL